MPVLTPEQLAEISSGAEELTRGLEEKLLEDISRRIAKAGTVVDSAEWQLMRLEETRRANEFIEKALEEYVQKTDEEIRRLFFDAGQRSDDFYSKAYAAAGKDFLPLEKNPEMLQLVEAGISQTKGELKNFTRSMGFSVSLPDGTTAFKPIEKAYRDALDLAQTQASTGVFDYTTAVRNATRTLCDGGLRFVDHASGRINHADAAVRGAVLAGVSQLTGKIAGRNAAELETDIVEVTAHAGARPDHAVWQGRRYSLSGKSKKYPSLVEVTGYGTGAGLKGWNCRHDFYPVIEGVSVPAYTEEELKNIDPPPIEYDGKTYTCCECTRRQRRIEAAMRKTRRQIISAKGAGDNDMVTAKSVLLRRQREEYYKFSNAAGNAAKALDKASGSGIIEETIGRSLSAKAKNYDVYNPQTGEIINLVEGSRITKPKNCIMAGKGRERKIDEIDFLVNKYGGNPDEWQKVKGFGYVYDKYGEERKVELHWYEEPTVGKVQMKIKVRNGEIYIDDD